MFYAVTSRSDIPRAVIMLWEYSIPNCSNSVYLLSLCNKKQQLYWLDETKQNPSEIRLR